MHLKNKSRAAHTTLSLHPKTLLYGVYSNQCKWYLFSGGFIPFHCLTRPNLYKNRNRNTHSHSHWCTRTCMIWSEQNTKKRNKTIIWIHSFRWNLNKTTLFAYRITPYGFVQQNYYFWKYEFPSYHLIWWWCMCIELVSNAKPTIFTFSIILSIKKGVHGMSAWQNHILDFPANMRLAE